MLKKLILKLVIALSFVAGCAGALAVAGPGTALAATAAAAQPATPAAAQAPLVQCPIIVHRFTTYAPDCGTETAERDCFSGNQGNLARIPNYAANGCIYRVWLYSDINETGSALCINPRSSTGFLSVVRRSYRIVSNQSDC